MIFLILLLSIVLFFNNIEAATVDNAQKSTFQDRFRQKIQARQLTQKLKELSSDRNTLPKIDASSDATTEILSPFSSANSSPQSTPAPSTKSSFSSNTGDSRVPPTPQSILSSKAVSSINKSRRVSGRRPPIIDDSIAQVFSYVSQIQDEEIQTQAFTAVSTATSPKDKEELALAWLQYLSTIKEATDRNEAARAVQTAPTANKQNEARLWCMYFTKIPAGYTRNEAIADVRYETLPENKELIAKIWAEYLSKIEEVKTQKRVASVIRKENHQNKELLAQEYLRVLKMNPRFLMQEAPTAVEKTNSWWKILRAIKDKTIREEARYCVEAIPTDKHDEKLLMAKLWQQYLSKISEKSSRDAAIIAIMREPLNRREGLAEDYYRSHRLAGV